MHVSKSVSVCVCVCVYVCVCVSMSGSGGERERERERADNNITFALLRLECQQKTHSRSDLDQVKSLQSILKGRVDRHTQTCTHAQTYTHTVDTTIALFYTPPYNHQWAVQDHALELEHQYSTQQQVEDGSQR